MLSRLYYTGLQECASGTTLLHQTPPLDGSKLPVAAQKRLIRMEPRLHGDHPRRLAASPMRTNHEHGRRTCWRATVVRTTTEEEREREREGEKNGRMVYGGCITKVGGSRWGGIAG